MPKEIKIANEARQLRTGLNFNDLTLDSLRVGRKTKLHFLRLILLKNLASQFTFILNHLQIQRMQEYILTTRRLIKEKTSFIWLFDFSFFVLNYWLHFKSFIHFLRGDKCCFCIEGCKAKLPIFFSKLGFDKVNCFSYKWQKLDFFGALFLLVIGFEDF